MVSGMDFCVKKPGKEKGGRRTASDYDETAEEEDGDDAPFLLWGHFEAHDLRDG